MSSPAADRPAPPVRVVGTGPVRVLVGHGWIADGTLWDVFAAHIDGTRFSWAFPDCRGYGARRGEPGPLSVTAAAHDAVAVADALGWTRFHVVGHSMGGMIAQRLLLDVPRRIASVALLAPVPASGARLDPARRELLLRAIADPAARRALLVVNTGGAQPPEFIDALLDLSLRGTSASALAAYLDSWSGTDFSRDLRPAAVPVLLAIGERDITCPEARMAETILRWHPHTSVHPLPGVGHYPMWEDPAALHRLLATHLALADVLPPPAVSSSPFPS